MKSVVLLMVPCLLASPAWAQDPAPTESGAASQPVSRPAPPPPEARHPWTLFVLAGTRFDSNINQGVDSLDAYGVMMGGGAWYRNDPTDPSFEFSYELAVHRFTATNRWNRLSHQLLAVWEHELADPLKLILTGEGSIKGTSEDRELTNQYLASPMLEYKMGQWHRVRAYAALRYKQNTEEADRSAANRYIGADFRQYSARGDRWEAGVRYEINAARGLRNRYNRWTYSTEYITPVTTRDRLEVGIKYRFQRYANRFVEVEDVDIRRADHRWIPAVRWVHAIEPGVELRAEYTLESRLSNDPRRDFSEHLMGLTIARRW